jgi:hypothetical protein
MKQSKGHVEFIGSYEFYKLPDGRMFRAETSKPFLDDGRRVGQFWTLGSGIEFALRVARLAVNPDEWGHRRGGI